MGITIHWELKFKGDKDEVIKKLILLKEIATKIGFAEVNSIKKLDYSKGFNDDIENSLQCPENPEGYRWAKIHYHPKDEINGNSSSPNKDYNKYYGYVLSCWAGEGCETTDIGLISKDRLNWSGGSFTKTQYAKSFVKAHLIVISLLDACRELGIIEEVSDEAEYWETRDLKVLGKNINASTIMISNLSKVLKQSFGKDVIKSSIDKSKNYVNIKEA